MSPRIPRVAHSLTDVQSANTTEMTRSAGHACLKYRPGPVYIPPSEPLYPSIYLQLHLRTINKHKMSTDTLVPILIYLTGETRTNEVVLVDENVSSFEEFAEALYTSLRPKIPDYYLESGERSITKAFVTWQPSDIFPRETEIVEGNIQAVLRLLVARRGVDTVRVWLNEID